jgi:hypothetical protein
MGEVNDFLAEGVLMNWTKLTTLDNRFQADLLTDALDKAEIPFLIREYKDTAYDGLFVSQKGWGTVMVSEDRLDEARRILEEFKGAWADHQG